ncbi:MAG: hypothetical protein ACRDBO_13480 [Lachnospiraceae bacterium]
MEDTAKQTTSLTDFTEVMLQLTDVVNALTEIEEQKAAAAADHQHHLINGFLSPEQAQILKLRGLEQKRIRLAAALGWQGLTFREILEQADNEQKTLLAPLLIELDRQIRGLTAAKDASDQMIRLRLKELEAVVAEQNGTSYGNGEKTAAPTSLHFSDQYV